VACLFILSVAGCAAAPRQVFFVQSPQEPVPLEQLASSSASLKNDHRHPSARTTIVVDIDDTLCVTDYNSVLWGFGSDDSRAFVNAARTLRELARDYGILYLSARPAFSSQRTRQWLDDHNFPSGSVIGAGGVVDYIAQTSFKKRTLARLQREGGGLLIGIGDGPRDSEAYRASGMVSVIVNPSRHATYHPSDFILKDWAGVAEFFAANKGVLTNPLKLAGNLKTGESGIMLPG